MSDLELLQEYAASGSQAAFATLVGRHVDVVYSAARRQVRAPELAEEVAQSVFTDLARRPHLKPGTPLVAWLYLVTRRTAIDAVRRETRRRAQEASALEIAAMKNDPSPWADVEPLLDEAMSTLDDADRGAVLLRFFENKSLREVGETLGSSENAAQKRVARALDQLRAFFVRRGVTVSAATLACDLSAHAAQAAPQGLGASIAAASVTLPILPPAVATAALALTTAQKIFVAATLALAVGGGLYQASALARQNDRRATLDARRASLQEEIVRLRTEREATLRTLAALRSARRPAPAVLTAGSDAALEAEMQSWMDRAVRLKLLLEERPEETIPEMKQFLTDESVFDAALRAKLGSEAEIRETLANLRHEARNTLGNKLPNALRTYLAAHDNTLPADLAALTPYFETPIDPAVFARYRMKFSGKLADVPARQRGTAIIEETNAPNEFYDSRLSMGTNGFSLGSFDPSAAAARSAIFRFKAAGNGAAPTSPEQLIPFFDPPLSAADAETFRARAPGYFRAAGLAP